MRLKTWGQHGTVRRYRQGGCNDLRGGEPGAGDRCAKCKEAMSKWNKRNRAGQNPISVKVSHLHSVDGGSKPSRTGSKTSPSSAGGNEQAVLTQFAELIAAGEEAVRIQMALTAARILDDPEARNIHPTTLRQLGDVMDKLTATRKTKSRGKLHSVSAMTNARRKSS